MTPDEMRAAIEPIYAATLEAHGGKYRAEVPEGVTPMTWHEVLRDDIDLQARAEGLAMVGLYYGCTEFAPIRVQDRGEAQVRGHMKNHKRERALIVHALGWKGIAK